MITTKYLKFFDYDPTISFIFFQRKETPSNFDIFARTKRLKKIVPESP